MKRAASSAHVIQYFLRSFREEAAAATAAQIRQTVELLGKELENNRILRMGYDELLLKFDRAESAACNAATQSERLLRQEFNKRANAFERLERELIASDYRLGDLEDKLADQRAYFSQNELLRFKARGCAHNPKVFANAMAGLPTIGCRQSFQLCSPRESPLWPSYHFRIFAFIETTWKHRFAGPDGNLEVQFQNAVLQLPRMVRIEKAVIERYKLDSTTQENYLRRFFRENWHYLRLATQQVTKRKKLRSNVVPYLITVRLFAKYGKPRTAEDVVVAELETLTD